MSNLEDLDVEAIDGSETMSLMGINVEELVTHASASKVKDIIDFFKGAPDKRYIIQRVMKPGIQDKVDHMWKYIQVKQEHKVISGEFNKIEESFNDVGIRKNMLESEIEAYEE